MERLQAHREFFSRLITANVGIADPKHPVKMAFAAVPREHFLGPGPWYVFTPSGYIQTPTADPAFLYQDITVALLRERQLNNGQPLLHAACLGALGVEAGEVVVHVGVGTGYYTAILSKLTGIEGKVFAYELDQELAVRATTNLQNLPNTFVSPTNGCIGPLPSCDAIYVNAGATGPSNCWLDSLNVGGRLMFPLTPADVSGRPSAGMMLLVTRVSETRFDARFVCQAAFTPCVGGRDPETAARLATAFARGGARNVRSLRREGIPDASCWCNGNGWWLSTADVSEA